MNIFTQCNENALITKIPMCTTRTLTMNSS